MELNNKNYVEIFKTLADDTRIEIITILSGGERCACKILENLDITQPTLSYHMKILTDIGLVVGRRRGSWMLYSLNKETFEDLGKKYDDFCSKISTEKVVNYCE